MLTQLKDRYNGLFRAIAIGIVCAFLVNSIAFAADFKNSPPIPGLEAQSNKLALPSRLNTKEFKQEFTALADKKIKSRYSLATPESISGILQNPSVRKRLGDTIQKLFIDGIETGFSCLVYEKEVKAGDISTTADKSYARVKIIPKKSIEGFKTLIIHSHPFIIYNYDMLDGSTKVVTEGSMLPGGDEFDELCRDFRAGAVGIVWGNGSEGFYLTMLTVNNIRDYSTLRAGYKYDYAGLVKAVSVRNAVRFYRITPNRELGIHFKTGKINTTLQEISTDEALSIRERVSINPQLVRDDDNRIFRGYEERALLEHRDLEPPKIAPAIEKTVSRLKLIIRLIRFKEFDLKNNREKSAIAWDAKCLVAQLKGLREALEIAKKRYQERYNLLAQHVEKEMRATGAKEIKWFNFAGEFNNDPTLKNIYSFTQGIAEEAINDMALAAEQKNIIAINLQGLGKQPAKKTAYIIANSLFWQVGIELANKFKGHANITSPITELLKNAFLHGNKLDFSSPIFLYFELDGKIVKAIHIFDTNSKKKLSKTEKEEVKKIGLGGNDGAIDDMKKKWEYHREAVLGPVGAQIGTHVTVQAHPASIGTRQRFEKLIADLQQARIAAIDFTNAVTALAAPTEDTPQKTIIVLGTSWIPGYSANDRSYQYKYLNNLIVKGIRQYCEKRGMPFLDREDEKLLYAISRARGQKGYENAKVIVLAKASTLTDILKSLHDDKNVFMMGVDASNISKKYDTAGEDYYIRIMEMLRIAIETEQYKDKYYENNPPPSPNIPIEFRKGFWIFIPNAERMKIESIEAIYAVQKSA